MPEDPNPKVRQPETPTVKYAPARPPYAELDVTTNFSFLRGASFPDELVVAATALGHTAIGVADVNSVAGVVRMHVAAKEVGIPLCVGVRLRFIDAPDVLVWVADRTGWANLCRMLTTGKRRTEKGQCTLHLSDLTANADGLIAAVDFRGIESSAGGDAISLDPWPMYDIVFRLKHVFSDDRLSIAVSRLITPDDEGFVRLATEVGRKCGVPLLVTNGVHYHVPSRRMLQDVVTCVRHGCRIQDAGFRLFPNGERHLKKPDLIYALFPDLRNAVSRSVDVARRCAGFSLDQLRYEYPGEVVPTGHTPASHLARLTSEGAEKMYPHGVPPSMREQIAKELSLIAERKYEHYFLTVHDIVRYAESQNILCQGRGSAANSVVCYCLGITKIDPEIMGGGLFARFINSAREEPPDIDVDFEHERREEVIQYVYNKYGRDRAGMTAELITYRGRSGVRDVGKALGLGLDAIDSIAKRLDWWHSGKLSREQIVEAGLDPDDNAIALLVALTSELLGFPRHLSQHVGGMVMTQGPLCELVPIENAAMAERTVIEWDKADIDALDILKVDLLALGMLTAIAKAMKLVDETRHCDDSGTPGALTLTSMPKEDPDVYAMISNADTVGVFQVESRAQMSMLPRLKPREFYDLVIEVAIVRPGPIQGNMVHPYLRRRTGEEPVSFPDPTLEKILHKTLGVPLFQEQAMKIVMQAAGFSDVDADRFRRSMAAWKHDGRISHFQTQVIDGMIKNGYTPKFAEDCFNQIKGFGDYGFPESHAASFALLVYASCWLKRRHPAAFTCALLNSQPMGFYAPAQLVRDAREHGVTVLPVDVNHSDWDCTLGRDNARDASRTAEKYYDPTSWGVGGPSVRLGLRMVRGFRQDHARRVVAKRHAIGSGYASVDHFHEATELPVSAVARLSQADAFASLGNRRAALWDALALPHERPQLRPARRSSPTVSETAPFLPGMSPGEEVHADYANTGLSLKGHPVGLAREHLRRSKITTAIDLWPVKNGTRVRVAGLVLLRQRPGTAKGIVFMTLEDETGIVNLVVHAAVYEHYRAAARGAQMLLADGYVQREGQVTHVVAIKLENVSELIRNYEVKSRDFR